MFLYIFAVKFFYALLLILRLIKLRLMIIDKSTLGFRSSSIFVSVFSFEKLFSNFFFKKLKESGEIVLDNT